MARRSLPAGTRGSFPFETLFTPSYSKSFWFLKCVFSPPSGGDDTLHLLEVINLPLRSLPLAGTFPVIDGAC
jgi:hypothetical protein